MSYSVGGILCIFFPVRRCFSLYRDIFSVTKLRRFLTCSGEVSDYICSSEVLNWIWDYNIICFESCFVFPPMLFLFRVGGCYSVTIDFNLFSGRACILILLDEQRHLVGRF